VRAGFHPGHRVSRSRVVRATSKAGAALFRLVCANLRDPVPRLAYGEMAGLRSAVMASVDGRVARNSAVEAARASLWGLYGVELTGGRTDWMSHLAEELPIETEFTSDGQRIAIDGEERLRIAADARFALAERLQQAGRAAAPEPASTPRELDRMLRSREKFHRLDEVLLQTCQLESCQGYDAAEEAELLVTEAVAVYEQLADRASRYGPNDLASARSRRDDVLRHLR
jgi:hypothetical protein